MLSVTDKEFFLEWEDLRFKWVPRLEADGLDWPVAGMRLPGAAPDRAVFRSEAGLEWRFHWRREGAAFYLESELANQGAASVRLGAVHLLDVRHPVALAPAAHDVVALANSGYQAPCMAQALASEQALRSSKVLFQFFNRTVRRAWQVGFQTFLRADTTVAYEQTGADGLCALRAWCDYAGWQLPAGATLTLETMVLRLGADPLAQLVDWAESAAVIVKPKFRDAAPLGWLGWSWVDAINDPERQERIALENVAAINRRLKGFGFDYLWISISNLNGGMPGDWLGWNHDNFKSTPRQFISKVRKKGWKLGLWCSPFGVSSALRGMVAEFDEALLRTPEGELLATCKQWSHGDAGRLPREQRPCLYSLDPTHPKSLEFIKRVFETYRRWDVRYFMLDFLLEGAGQTCGLPYRSTFDQSKVPGPDAYRVFMRRIREAAGPDTYLLACTGPFLHSAGLADGARTGNDFGEGRALNPESYFYPATYIMGLRFWTGAREALLNQASRFYTHRRLFLNDSGNVLTVDHPLPLSHAQVHATLHALSGGPTMLGDDIRHISPERLALIKATLPRPRDVAVPVDLFDAPGPDGARIFHRRIDKPWGRFDVVAVYNLGAAPASVTVDFTRLGLAPDRDYVIWEFWDRHYAGGARGVLEVWMPPESVKVFRLTACAGHPQVMGTDMHLTMGEMELTDASYNPKTRRLRLRAVRPAGERGGVYLHAPPGVCVKNFAGLHLGKGTGDKSLVIYVPLEFKNGRAARDIVFAPVQSENKLAAVNPG